MIRKRYSNELSSVLNEWIDAARTLYGIEVALLYKHAKQISFSESQQLNIILDRSLLLLTKSTFEISSWQLTVEIKEQVICLNLTCSYPTAPKLKKQSTAMGHRQKEVIAMYSVLKKSLESIHGEFIFKQRPKDLSMIFMLPLAPQNNSAKKNQGITNTLNDPLASVAL